MTLRHLLIIFLILPLLAHSGDPVKKKSMSALRIENAPKIDADLSDPVWRNAEKATNFVQNNINPGQPANQKTEVQILYTDEAVYLGVTLFDSNPDSIMRQLTERDGFGNTDFFGVIFSCFADGINAFEFFVTPKNVQMDAQVSTFGEDFNWNAVWQSEAKITSEGWVVEMKIPFSALRFPNQEVQNWDINFVRDVRKTREKSFWNHVDPLVDGVINQSGSLTGIEDIEPPMRLFLFPYFSAYQIYDDDGKQTIGSNALNGGMDLKYGLNDAFTLDMTLIPDFGQVLSDNQVLNLSAFEVQFNENRQFFTEGTELFNKGNLFYSRRIGGLPVNYYSAGEGEEIISQPGETQLVNAAKISGRNSKGLGIGILNAVTQREYAVVRDSTGREFEVETSPLTNYNILVFDQNLKNNSYVTLINTNVMRDGATYDANVIGTEFNIRDKENKFQISGNAKYNKKFNVSEHEPDDGYAYGLGAAKIKGQLTFGADMNVESKNFDPNDLGILFAPNEVWFGNWASYNIVEPFWKGKFNSLWADVWTGYSMLQSPNVYTGKNIGAGIGMNTAGFNTFGGNFNISPGNQYDYFEPRVDGMYFKTPTAWNYNIWISTDYRKKVALDASIWQNFVGMGGWNSFNWRVAPRFQFGDKLLLTYVYSRQNNFNQHGFTTMDDDDNPIFTRRNRINHTHVVNANYVFNNRMSASFRLRHYWSFVDQKEFYDLTNTGELIISDFSQPNDEGKSDYDINYNAFSIDLVYRWVFAPGSEVFVVWKKNLAGDDNVLQNNYYDNWDFMFDNIGQRDSFSIRVLYFIDFYTTKKKLFG